MEWQGKGRQFQELGKVSKPQDRGREVHQKGS
jgi:hypothetical protein